MVTRRVRTEFDANTAQFDRGVRRMNDNMRRFQRGTETRLDRIDRRFRRASQGVATFQKAIAGLAVAAGLRRLQTSVQGAVSRLDELAKTADKLGITTDALQELRVAAELSGVAINTFDMAFQRFTRRAAEAAEGTGEAKDALNQLGIELRDAEGRIRPMETVLLDVADAFTEIEDPATRVRLAFKLFDSEGVAVVNMLARGSEGLEEMRGRARELGLVIENDLIRRNVELRDELTLLQRQLDTDTTEALVRLGPVIRDLGQLFVWLANRAAQAHEGFRQLFSGDLAQTISDLGIREELDAARAALAGFDEELERALDPATRSTELQVKLNFAQNRASIEGREFDETNFILEEFANRRTELVDRVESLQQRLGRILQETGGGEDLVTAPPAPELPSGGGGGGGSGGGGGGGSTSAAATEERTSALERELRVLAERTAELRRMAEAMARLNPEMEGYETALRTAEIEARLLTRAEADGVEVTDRLAAKIREVARGYAEAEAASSQLRDTQEDLEESSRVFEDLARGIEGAISQARTFEEALQNVLAVMLRIAAQQGGEFLGGQLASIFSPATFPTSVHGANLEGLTFHRGGVVGRDGTPRTLPATTWMDAPRLHSGGAIGLRQNEVPAILENGEIVVPKNIGMGREAPNITINQPVTVNGSGLSEDQLRAAVGEALKRDRPNMLREVQQKFMHDGGYLSGAG